MAFCLFLVFVILAVLTLNGTFHVFETSVQNWILKIRTPSMTSAIKIITYLGSFSILAGLTVLLIIIPYTRKKYGYPIAAALCVSALVNIILKNIFCRPRPDGMIVAEVGYSFPSGHAQGSAAFFVALILLLLMNVKRLRIIPLIITCIIIPIVVGFTRIYLGVHYIGDVIAGFALGASVAIGMVVLWFMVGEMLKKHEKLYRFFYEEEG